MRLRNQLEAAEHAELVLHMASHHHMDMLRCSEAEARGFHEHEHGDGFGFEPHEPESRVWDGQQAGAIWAEAGQ